MKSAFKQIYFQKIAPEGCNDGAVGGGDEL